MDLDQQTQALLGWLETSIPNHRKQPRQHDGLVFLMLNKAKQLEPETQATEKAVDQCQCCDELIGVLGKPEAQFYC